MDACLHFIYSVCCCGWSLFCSVQFIRYLFIFVCHVFAASLCEAMKEQRETPVVQEIGDVMLARVSLRVGRVTSISLHLNLVSL